MQCKCGGARVPKRKAEAPAQRRPRRNGKPSAAASGASGASSASGASGASSAGLQSLKNCVVQRLVLYKAIVKYFMQTGTRNVYLKKFDAADGKVSK